MDVLVGCRKPSGSCGNAALERGLAAHWVPTMLIAIGLLLFGSRMWMLLSMLRPKGAPLGWYSSLPDENEIPNFCRYKSVVMLKLRKDGQPHNHRYNYSELFHLIFRAVTE